MAIETYVDFTLEQALHGNYDHVFTLTRNELNEVVRSMDYPRTQFVDIDDYRQSVHDWLKDGWRIDETFQVGRQKLSIFRDGRTLEYGYIIRNNVEGEVISDGTFFSKSDAEFWGRDRCEVLINRRNKNR